MFGVPLDGMTPELRRQAKTINFGIIYGISAFGLAKRLGIGNEEASTSSSSISSAFPASATYIDETKKICRDEGLRDDPVRPRLPLPADQIAQPAERAGVERQAINAPIQGTAADIIRRAMARMEDALREAKLSARMLLQVHDELVFEAPDDEVEATIPVISRVMTKPRSRP